MPASAWVEIPERLNAIRARIAHAAIRAGRPPESVRLVAVSKKKPPEAIRAAYAVGQRDFGENYAQELSAKAAALADLVDLRWHFIGSLQRNKARNVVGVHLVQSVDREELVRELDRRASGPLEILIEVNVTGEASKGGCTPAALPALLEQIGASAHLRASGLMGMAPEGSSAKEARATFVALRVLRDRHRDALGRGELSMGMSGDFEEAIEEGATLVRVGTAIFGERA